MANDIVRDFLRMVQEMDPQRPHPDLWHLERRIRELWGGQRTYVCKAQPDLKVRRLAESLAAGQPLSEAIRALGVHHRTCRRYMRRRWVSGY